MYQLAALAILLLPSVVALQGIQGRQTTCGVKGYDKGTSAYYYKRAAGAAACGALCTADSNCKSWASGQGYCLLYSKTL